jgi:hypothetical protein
MGTEQNQVYLGKGDLTLDAWGHQVVSRRFSLFHSLFTFDVPQRLFRGEIDGIEIDLSASEFITSVNGALNLITSGTNGEVVLLESRRHPRYQPNRSHNYSASIGIPVPVSNAVQDFGLFTSTNGVFFRCNVDGDLYACIMSGGILTHEEPITLPDTFPDDFDISKGHNYDIQFQWRGVGDYFFYIENPKTHSSQKVHTIRVLGTLNGVSMQNPALPIAYRITSLGAVDGLWSGCADITSSGGGIDRQQYYSAIGGPVTISTNTAIIAIRQPDLINGEINTRDIMLARLYVEADKKSSIDFYLTRDPTSIVGGTWEPTNSGSFVEENKAITSIDVTKMQRFTTVKMPALGSDRIDNPNPNYIDFYLIHGDNLVVAGNGANAAAEVVLEWGEEI